MCEKNTNKKEEYFIEEHFYRKTMDVELLKYVIECEMTSIRHLNL